MVRTFSHSAGSLALRRATRARRAAESRALRAEFELEPKRGFAALRGLVASVGELEQARISSHAASARRSGTRAGVSTAPAPAASH